MLCKVYGVPFFPGIAMRGIALEIFLRRILG